MQSVPKLVPARSIIQNSAASARPTFIPALTGIRAFAAFWVVGYHLLPIVQALLPRWIYLFYRSVFNTDYLGVDLFFILSGFILSLNYSEKLSQEKFSPKEIFRFLWARIARIYPVHLFCLLILIPAVFMMHRLHVQVDPARFSVKALIENIFMVQAWRPNAIIQLTWNAPAWSISCEWLAYLFFPLLIFMFARSQTVRAWPIAVLLFLVPALIYLEGTFIHFGYLDTFIRIACEFTAGVLMYQCFRAGIGAQARWDVILTTTFIALLLLSVLFIQFGLGYQAYLLIPLLAILIYGLAWHQGSWNSFFASWAAVYWGAVSYSLYMTHDIWLLAVKAVLPVSRFLTSGLLVRLGILAAYFLPMLLVAVLTYIVIEEPARKLLNRVIHKNSSGPARVVAD